MEEMNQGKAMAIVKDIYRRDFRSLEKKAAIKKVMAMETINCVTKEQLRNVVRWLMDMPERQAKKTKQKGETA